MAAIPQAEGSSLVDLIDRRFAEQADLTPRAHLGASILGRECERMIWYSFRWIVTENKFDGRMLRLFARGQREEASFAELLRIAGCTVQQEGSDGRQFNFKEEGLGGHLSGSIDGIAQGIPEAPDKWHVLEMKTHNDKSFKKLCEVGVRKAKPEHFDQMQLYMRWTDLDRALYMAVNKNDDSLYFERVAYDKARSEQLVAKAARIIAANEAPARLSEDPSWWQCKFCDFHAVCHGAALPSVNCRTCMHSTPLTGDRVDAPWHCAKWDCEVPLEETRKAQACHRYIPSLISWAAPIDATDSGDVIYEMRDGSGRSFANGEKQPAFTSLELRAIDLAAIGDDGLQNLREQFDGRVVDGPLEFEEEEIPF
jgi:CRISPR/Cas system-associated exonuclease Cas4 (RecB family)